MTDEELITELEYRGYIVFKRDGMNHSKLKYFDSRPLTIREHNTLAYHRKKAKQKNMPFNAIEFVQKNFPE